MARISINTFGGEQPSVSARELPVTAARKSLNLDSRVNEFRPLKVNLTVAISGPNDKKLTRLSRTATGELNTDMTTNWIVSSIFYNSAPGQVNDDKTGRTYYSAADGSNALGVRDAIGVNKPLGVPIPSRATGQLVVVAQYTPEQDVAARVTIPKAVYDACLANFSPIYLGAAPTNPPSAGSAGWLAHGAISSLPTTKAGEWAYLAPMVIGSGGGYVMQYPATSDALLAPGLSGRQVTYLSSVFWAVPVGLQGRGYTINRSGLIAALQAIPNPATGGVLFVSPASAVDSVIADYSAEKEPQAGMVAELNGAIAAMNRTYDAGGGQTIESNTAKSFFSKADVVAEINAAISRFAASVVAYESDIIAPAYVPFTAVRGDR